jgi:predicted dehydrogenase
MLPIITALSSFGMSGRVFHAPFINKHEGFKLHGILERTNRGAAEAYPGVKIFSSFDELLADAKIELVIVNTPNATHYEFAKKALQADKHVIVEKPFTVTVAEAQELIALARKADKIISVFQNRRWDSDFQTVKRIVDQKLLGDIVEAEIHYDRYNEELSPKVHKEIPGPGTGLIYDLGSHLIDQALQLFKMPLAVFADMHCVRPVSKVNDYMEVLLYYPQLRVRLKASYVVREPLPSYILHGLKGSFIKSRGDVQEGLLQSGIFPVDDQWGQEPDAEKGLLHTEKDGAIIREHVETERGNYGAYYERVYNAIRRSNDEIPVTSEEAINVMKIIEAANLSNKQRKVIEI